MSKRPVYLPIELHDVFELLEERKSDMIYFIIAKGSLAQANEYSLRLSELPNVAFYVKQEYTSVRDQGVGKNETNQSTFKKLCGYLKKFDGKGNKRKKDEGYPCAY